jgi:hypothetical protein
MNAASSEERVWEVTVWMKGPRSESVNSDSVVSTRTLEGVGDENERQKGGP